MRTFLASAKITPLRPPAGFDGRLLPDDFSLFARPSLLSEVAIAECGTPMECNLRSILSQQDFYYHCTYPIDRNGDRVGPDCGRHRFADAKLTDDQLWDEYRQLRRIRLGSRSAYRRRQRIVNDIAVTVVDTTPGRPLVTRWVTRAEMDAPGFDEPDITRLAAGFTQRLLRGHVRRQGMRKLTS